MLVKERNFDKWHNGNLKREHLLPVDWKGNFCSHYGNQYGSLFKSYKIDLPHDLAILSLGILLRDSISYSRDNFSSMIITEYSQHPANRNNLCVNQLSNFYTIEYFQLLKIRACSDIVSNFFLQRLEFFVIHVFYRLGHSYPMIFYIICGYIWRVLFPLCFLRPLPWIGVGFCQRVFCHLMRWEFFFQKLSR